MKQYNGKEITQIYYKDKVLGKIPISRVYRKIPNTLLLIWEAVRSCFGKGFWIDDKPWSDIDGYKDNK